MTLIRYYGHVGVQSGYGVAAAETCMAILAAGFELEISTNGTQLPRRFLPLANCIRGSGDLSRPDVVIVHTLPLDGTRVLAAERIRESFPAALCISYTTWEGARVAPDDVLAAQEAFDMVWVPCHYNARHFRRGTPRSTAPRIERVPHAFDPSRDASRWARCDDEYRFYYIGAWNARKNVDGLIRAFAGIFTQRQLMNSPKTPRLTIHSPGTDRQVFIRSLLSSGVPEDVMPLVTFQNELLCDEAIADIHRGSDCFVTTSRGEAWNLPAFDAVRHRCHVIVPQFHGSDDYLDAFYMRHGTSAELYKGSNQPAFLDVEVADNEVRVRGPQGVDARTAWREPDLGDLQFHMLGSFNANITELKIGYDLAAEFGYEAVGQRIRTLIEGATK